MNLGRKIKQMRNQLGLTQEELADRCELTKGYISQLENNLNSPSIATLADILAALGSNLAEFFQEETEEKVVFSKNEFIEKDSALERRFQPVIVEEPSLESAKEMIYGAVGNLIESAPDSCVYLSFFGDSVTSSDVVTRDNYKEYEENFYNQVTNKYFYDAVYAKLAEFSDISTEKDADAKVEVGYKKNANISKRAKELLEIFKEKT